MKNSAGKGRAIYEVSFLSSIRARRYINKKELKFDRFPVDMLCFVTDGVGKLFIGDEMTEIGPMRLYYLPRGEAIKASVSSESVGLYLLAFEYFAGGKAAAERKGTRLSLLASRPSSLPRGSIRLRGTDRILNWIRQLYEATGSQSKGCRLQLLFQELLNGIAQEYEAGAERKSAQSGIELAIAHMKANFRSKLDMGTVADIANLTLSSFSAFSKKRRENLRSNI
ncbi:hypothetical protein [Cohnella faecalis]|uniref:hypothetical protein n=1 Tax=Cohnella faecalis TaxID=2315694 RepID=UPI001F305B36|nr:hypothetical protein [Cohnella faecalis]